MADINDLLREMENRLKHLDDSLDTAPDRVYAEGVNFGFRIATTWVRVWIRVQEDEHE